MAATINVLPTGIVSLPLASKASNLNTPAANTAAVVTLSAVAGVRNVIDAVAWSYTGGTPVGNLQIADGANVIFNIDITAAGPGWIRFPRPLANSLVNTALTITLGAGGSGITGKVNAVGARTE